jgi:arabinogalactan oligomer/maltooligosaccharide transport system substrate-binding protein
MAKHKLLVLASTSVLSLSLVAACGGGDTDSTGQAAPTTESPSATATASATATETPTPTASETGPPTRANADLVIWADPDRAKFLKKYADQFGEENGISVAVQVVNDTRVPFKDATNVGKGPDIVVGAHDWLGELVQNNTVAPVQLSADVASKFQESAIEATKFNGQGYGVPYAIENMALVRNTEMAPEAPKTMEELIAAGQKIKSGSGGKVTNVMVQVMGKVGNAYNTYPYLSAYKGGIFGETSNGGYDPKKLIVNSPASIKGAEQLAKLGKAGVLSTNIGDDNAEGLFTSKKAPFYITGPWAIQNIKKAGIKYAISPLPTLAGGGQMQPFLGVQMFYVSAKAKNAAFAQEFVTNYVPRKDVQLELFKSGSRPPALIEAYDEVAASDPDVKAFFEAGKDSKAMPNIPAMNAVWGPLGQAAADVISGKQAPKARFDAAQKEIQSNISKG